MKQWDFTLADFPVIAARYLVTAGSAVTPTTLVYAPCCGRKTLADTVVDVRAIPGTHVMAGGRRPRADLDWACDGCLHRLFSDPSNDWTKSKLLAARGGPAALVAEHLVHERVQIAYRELWAKGTSKDTADLHVEITQQIRTEQRQAAEAEAYAAN